MDYINALDILHCHSILSLMQLILNLALEKYYFEKGNYFMKEDHIDLAQGSFLFVVIIFDKPRALHGEVKHVVVEVGGIVGLAEVCMKY
ncbi:hypothetical protein CsSME_00040244 [Camellia sinensis var. sinensis]